MHIIVFLGCNSHHFDRKLERSNSYICAMKKNLLIAFLLFISIALNAQSLSGPESIEYDAANNRYLISNTNSGQILARSANGTLSVFKSGISPAPYGLEILGNRVYACCSGFIKGFNLQTGAQEFNLNLGATFLNGITTDGIGNLFATDFSAKKIYRIKPSSNSYNVMASNLVQSPNGICYDQANNRLVFVNWGSNAPIKSLSLSDSLVYTLTNTNLGNCDGIVWNGLDSWYVTVWTGQKVMKFDANFAAGPILVANALSSPADIDYNEEGDTLAIPNSGNNTLTFIGLPAIVNVDCNLLPIQVIDSEISFEGSVLSFGDSVLRVPLLNASGLGFAYPLARLSVIGDLPSGMAFGNNQDAFNVFASAWNPDSIAVAEFYFAVAEPIQPNTQLTFELDITNLAPSSADTCFFSETFTVNLNPDNTVGMDSPELIGFSAYPNPCNDKLFLSLNSQDEIHDIALYSITGELLFQQNTLANTELNVSELPRGMYFISALVNDGLVQGKFIKH
jgi:hypothetical protein